MTNYIVIYIYMYMYILTIISAILSIYREMGFVELQQLTKISSWCEQYIQYNCLNAPLRSVHALLRLNAIIRLVKLVWSVNHVMVGRWEGRGWIGVSFVIITKSYILSHCHFINCRLGNLTHFKSIDGGVVQYIGKTDSEFTPGCSMGTCNCDYGIMIQYRYIIDISM